MSALPTVNRLVDMVVEEVSLVDRAANKHRFLLVKRDDMAKARTAGGKPKADEEEDETGKGKRPTSKAKPPPVPPRRKPAADALDDEEADDEESDDEEEPPKRPAPRRPKRGNAPALDVVLAAIDKLATAVEELDGDSFDASALGPLAEDLRSAAADVAKAAGDDEDPAAERAEIEEDGTGELISAMRQMMGRLEEVLAGAAKPGPSPAQAPAAAVTTAAAPADAPTSEVGKTLATIAASFVALDASIKAQAERLAGLEKRTGLPNSTAPGDAPRRPRGETSWPLDINRPMDRDSVDKSLSFHD